LFAGFLDQLCPQRFVILFLHHQHDYLHTQLDTQCLATASASKAFKLDCRYKSTWDSMTQNREVDEFVYEAVTKDTFFEGNYKL
jgi:hypothetical protein